MINFPALLPLVPLLFVMAISTSAAAEDSENSRRGKNIQITSEILFKSYSSGSYTKAIKDAQEALNTTQESDEKHKRFAAEILAASLYKSKRYGEALQIYKSLTTEKVTHIFNLGNTHYKLGNYQEAAKNYQEYLTKVNDPKAESNLRLALQKLQQKKEERSDEEEDDEFSNDPNDTLGKLFAEFPTAEQGARGKKINLQKW